MPSWDELNGYSGTYTSPEIDISAPEIVRVSTISWVESSTPTCTIIMSTRFSIDGGESYTDWQEQTNGSAVVNLLGSNIIDARLQFKAEFNRNDDFSISSVDLVTITINNTYLQLNAGSSITYSESITEEFTNIFWIKLPSGYSGVFLTLGTDFEIGYNLTSQRFYYRNQDRVTAGAIRSIPSTFFRVAVKPSQIIIITDTYSEIIR